MKKIIIIGFVATLTTLLCGCDGQGNIKFNLKIDSLTIKTDSGTYVVNTDTTLNLHIKNTTTVTVEGMNEVDEDKNYDEIEALSDKAEKLAADAEKLADEAAKAAEMNVKAIEQSATEE